MRIYIVDFTQFEQEDYSIVIDAIQYHLLHITGGACIYLLISSHVYIYLRDLITAVMNVVQFYYKFMKNANGAVWFSFGKWPAKPMMKIELHVLVKDTERKLIKD